MKMCACWQFKICSCNGRPATFTRSKIAQYHY